MRNEDYEAVLGFVERLYAVRDRDEFPHWLMRELPKLVGADHITWNDVAFSVPYARILESPVLPGHERRNEVFTGLMLDHPTMRRWMATGDVRPAKLSDLVSVRELHRSRLYDELYRELGYEDQYGVPFTAPKPTTQAVALARDRRSFTERDRAVLTAVRPHLARAYESAQAFTRARRELAAHGDEAATLCAVELDADGRLVAPARRARSWLGRYFDRGRAPAERLPPAVATWIGRGARRPLIRRRGDRLLVLRLDLHQGRRLLLMEERTTIEGAAALRQWGLTRREREVLLELEQGKRNDEIAAALFISPRTVKKHLENIFAKLGVDNRTAAVLRLRGQRS